MIVPLTTPWPPSALSRSRLKVQTEEEYKLGKEDAGTKEDDMVRVRGVCLSLKSRCLF